MALRIVVLGRGAWGSTLAHLWQDRGHELRLWSRRDGGDPRPLLDGADLVVSAVSMAGVVTFVDAVNVGNVRLPALVDFSSDSAAPGAADASMACVWLPAAWLTVTADSVPGVDDSATGDDAPPPLTTVTLPPTLGAYRAAAGRPTLTTCVTPLMAPSNTWPAINALPVPTGPAVGVACAVS